MVDSAGGTSRKESDKLLQAGLASSWWVIETSCKRFELCKSLSSRGRKQEGKAYQLQHKYSLLSTQVLFDNIVPNSHTVTEDVCIICDAFKNTYVNHEIDTWDLGISTDA